MAKKTYIKLTLLRSTSGRLPRHRATVKGLGLSTIRQTVQVEDTPSIRGMITQVGYLLHVEQV